MGADTPTAIFLAASISNDYRNQAKSAEDAESQWSDSQEEEASLMDAYEIVLKSQVSKFDCFATKETQYKKKFMFDDWYTSKWSVTLYLR